MSLINKINEETLIEEHERISSSTWGYDNIWNQCVMEKRKRGLNLFVIGVTLELLFDTQEDTNRQYREGQLFSTISRFAKTYNDWYGKENVRIEIFASCYLKAKEIRKLRQTMKLLDLNWGCEALSNAGSVEFYLKKAEVNLFLSHCIKLARQAASVDVITGVVLSNSKLLLQMVSETYQRGDIVEVCSGFQKYLGVYRRACDDILKDASYNIYKKMLNEKGMTHTVYQMKNGKIIQNNISARDIQPYSRRVPENDLTLVKLKTHRKVIVFGIDDILQKEIVEKVFMCELIKANCWQDIIAIDYDIAVIDPEIIAEEGIRGIATFYNEVNPYTEPIVLVNHNEILEGIIGIRYCNNPGEVILRGKEYFHV